MLLGGEGSTGDFVGVLECSTLQFAADKKVRATVSVEPLENVYSIFQRMRDGQFEGRIVMTI